MQHYVGEIWLGEHGLLIGEYLPAVTLAALNEAIADNRGACPNCG